MSVVYPDHPIDDKKLLVGILGSFWYNYCIEYEPDAWSNIQNSSNNQLRQLFDATMQENYRFKSFVMKSIKLCYGGGFFGPSTLAINSFLTDVRNEINNW